MEFNVFAVRYNSTTKLDEPINLTGAKVWFYVKKTRRDADNAAVISYDTVADPAQVTIVDAPLGVIRVRILAADSAALPVSYLPYDVQLKENDGTVTTISRGFLEIDRDTTIVQT
jgi:hypothetical protein